MQKTTSLQVIISKVVRDLGIGQEEVPFQDFIEWMVEAIQHVGAFKYYDQKSATLEVSNHMALMPCDLYRLMSVRGSNAPSYRSGSGQNSKFLHYNPMLVAKNSEEYEDKQHYIEADYRIERDRILTSFKTGALEITYQAIPTGEDGFPLVPDDISYADALFWYVCYKLAIRGYEFKSPQLRDINFSRQKWNFYVKQARAEANMPDPDQIQRIAQQWLRLVPNVDAYYTDFIETTERQNIVMDRHNNRF